MLLLLARYRQSPSECPIRKPATSTPRPAFFFGKSSLPVPAFRHQQMRNLRRVGTRQVSGGEVARRAGLNTLGKACASLMFFLGPALTLPLVLGWRLFGDRRIRPLVVDRRRMRGRTGAQYLVLRALRCPDDRVGSTPSCSRACAMCAWRRDGSPVGIAIARLVPVTCLGMALLRVWCAAAQFLYAAGSGR